MAQLPLFKYFKSSSSKKVVLPCPNGPLSHEVPSTVISAANKEVEEVMATCTDSVTKKRGAYLKFTPKQKATIGNYALLNGTSAALCHFIKEFPDLKYTTVCNWRKAVSTQQKKQHESVTELHGKKRGQPPTLL